MPTTQISERSVYVFINYCFKILHVSCLTSTLTIGANFSRCICATFISIRHARTVLSENTEIQHRCGHINRLTYFYYEE